MNRKESLLFTYLNYHPEQDPNGSQGHAIAESIDTVFGGLENFNNYKNAYEKKQKQKFKPTYSTGLTNEEAREEAIKRIKKRLEDSL